MDAQNLSSLTSWDTHAGSCRVVRLGSTIYVSGTTATGSDGRMVGRGDVYLQTRQALLNIGVALSSVGAGLQHLVCVRVQMLAGCDSEAVRRAQAEVLGELHPSATMVEVPVLIDPEALIEIEADAVMSL